MKYLKIFTDFAEKADQLNDAEVGRLFKAMLVYAETGTEQDLKGNERFLWSTARQEINRQRASYNNKVEGAAIARGMRSDIRANQRQSDRLTLISSQDKDKEKDKDKKEKISTDVDIQKKAAVISLLLNDGTEYGVEQEAIEKWENLYPAVNVMQELRKMAGWLDANRTRRKTRRGIEKFINGWLAREQDKGGVQRGITGTDVEADGGGFDFSQVFKQPWERDDWEDS